MDVTSVRCGDAGQEGPYAARWPAPPPPRIIDRAIPPAIGGQTVTLDEQTVQEYRAAYTRWMDDLRQLHEVLLEGKPLDPLHRIALLRRESHSKERYEAARAKLLGLPDADESGSSLFAEQ